MNHKLFAFGFLQELRKNNNDMKSEEEKKMEYARPTELLPWLQLIYKWWPWIVQCLAHMFYFLLKYDQIEKAHQDAAVFEDILSKRNTILKLY